MTIKTYFITLLCVLIALIATAQDNDNIFDRLQGIHNPNADFYNVDGFEISTQVKDGELSVKNILKKFKKYPVSEASLVADGELGFNNFYTYSKKEDSGVTQHSSYYFIEGPEQKLTCILFNSFNKTDKEFERRFVQLIRTDAIPDSVFTRMRIDTINFAGRQLALGPACRWMGINNVQCSGNGQMNWSVHKTQEDAALSVSSQLALIANRKEGKIIADVPVDIVFEGFAITARKLTYDFKGVTSALAGMSGGKTLTIYAVAAPARGNWVSCIMSHWNNDIIRSGGLPGLLEEVMELKH